MLNPIKSVKAKCRDCHKCIRFCPVKAIKMRDGQAQVVPEQCITCGTCLATCPQNAKTALSSVDLVSSMLKSEKRVYVSLAPSYPAAFEDLSPGQVIAGLMALGFTQIEETAMAAEPTAQHYQQLLQTHRTVISSCCPVAVNMIEIYFPQLIVYLANSASPMVTHGADLHRRFPDAKVVFIGPCVAKVQEASRQYAANKVDAVLTFGQLFELWQLHGINPSELSAQRAMGESNAAAAYPLSRGILSTLGLRADELADYLSVSGVRNCMQVFRELKDGKITPRFIEALACSDGCIGGPGMHGCQSIVSRRSKVVSWHQIRYQRHKKPAEEPGTTNKVEKASFKDRHRTLRPPSENEIRSILERIGKSSPDDETNCGGCGYPTCRDKAIAAHHGLAEITMCVPYMRAKFESLSHLVVDSSMDAVIIANRDLTIHHLNPAARRLFKLGGRPTKGEHLGAIIDAGNFEDVMDSGEMLRKRVDYCQLGIYTSQVIYPLPEYGLVVGVITDITGVEQQRKVLEKKHAMTIERASKVIKNQMKLAQEIAGLLGEATSETKATLLELISTLEDEAGAP